MTIDGDRLARLREVKLRALVRDRWPAAVAGVSHGFPNGAALVADGSTVVLVESEPRRVLGGALLFASRHDATRLELVLDPSNVIGDPVDLSDGIGVTARRAGELVPPVGVWRVQGTELVAAEPSPLPDEPAVPPESEAFAPALLAAGIEVVREHGLLLGEVHGLEVARVEAGELSVGVGRFDREAAAVIWSDRPTEVALAAVVHEVEKYRRSNAEPHPINRLCRERWLRTQVVADPALVGLTNLVPVSPPEPRPNLRDPSPAAAVGVDDTGGRVLVVCSVGADVELVPVAADLVAREHVDDVIFVTPKRDQLRYLAVAAARLSVPVRFVAVEGNWPAPL
jgi:hypothetical protein